MSMIKADEAPRFELPGIQFTGLAAPSRGSGELCTWRIRVAPGLDSPDPHTLDRDEVFMVLAGSVRITPHGPVAGPGDVVVVPAGDPIQLSNPGDSTAEVYVAITAGFTGTLADGTSVRPPWAE